MTPIDSLVEDPIIQLLLIVVFAIGVFDAFKFAASWILKKFRNEDDNV